MSLDNRLVLAMEPGHSYGVVALATKMRADYASVYFGLARLEEFGFVERAEDETYSLTPPGRRLRFILVRANGSGSSS